MLHGIVYVELVNGFYFSTDVDSAEVLRRYINASCFSGGEWSRVLDVLKTNGYALLEAE